MNPASRTDRDPRESPAPFRPEWRRELPWSLLAWGLFALAMSQTIHLWFALTSERVPPWLNVFRWAAFDSLIWALATPVVFALGRTFTFVRPRVARAVVVHLATALALHVIAAAADWALHPWLRPLQPRSTLVASFLSDVWFDLLRYAALVVGVQAFELRRSLARQQRDALRLRAELLEAQLHMLRMQLQPHFLFNALHAISELAYRDPRLADRAITSLADLLRQSLAAGARHEVTLDEERVMLDAYLDIERLRAGDSLVVEWNLADDCLGARVPVLVLQPLVENALRHGVRGAPRAHVLVAAHRVGDQLELRVEDDGRGLAPGGVHDGLGLRSTRARLHGLYDTRFTLEVTDRPGGGAVSRVRLPFHLHTAAAIGPDAGVAS